MVSGSLRFGKWIGEADNEKSELRQTRFCQTNGRTLSQKALCAVKRLKSNSPKLGNSKLTPQLIVKIVSFNRQDGQTSNSMPGREGGRARAIEEGVETTFRTLINKPEVAKYSQRL